MRVLHIKAHLAVDGVMTCETEYAKALAPAVTYDWLVNEVRSERVEKTFREMGSEIYFAPQFGGAKDFFREFRFYRRFFREHHYDVIHIDTDQHRWKLLMFAWLSGVKKRIIHSHCAGETKKTVRQFLVRLFATDYLACGQAAGVYMFGTRGVQSKKFVVLNNAFSLDEFRFAPAVREKVRAQMRASNKTVVLFCGRFEMVKNPLMVVEIMKALVESGADTECWMVGDGTLKDAVLRQVFDLYLSPYVKLLGIRDDIPKLLQAADILLMPSVYEGLSYAMVEAQASGLPVLTSTGVSTEVNLTGTVHFLPLSAGVEAWAEQVAALTEQPLDRTAVAGLIREKGYDITENAEKLIEVYKR